MGVRGKYGVTYETLGINGAQAPMLLDWNESVRREQLAQSRSGTDRGRLWNQRSAQPEFGRPEYRAALTEMIDALAAAPLRLPAFW